MSARLSLVPSPRTKRFMPNEYDLSRLPIARAGEFELNDREVKQTRRLIYSINKQGQFRYRTMRDGPFLQIWRIK